MDSDWLPSRKLNLSPAASESFLRAVERDVKYLRSAGLMDYSLLLGIHNVTERRVMRTEHRGGRSETSLPDGRGAATSSAAASSSLKEGGSLSSLPTISASDYHSGPLSFSPTTLEGPGLYRAGSSTCLG